ncbi:hypothetical protein ACR78H_25035 [Sphingobacterium siyangense]|uniref:hypothetical protein n=1 Tax=Sphingobacterium siyangense TaxID=459529 RepID=UPI003DA37773
MNTQTLQSIIDAQEHKIQQLNAMLDLIFILMVSAALLVLIIILFISTQLKKSN